MLEELATLAMKEAKSSGKCIVPGLGKVMKANRKARRGRNPQTGEAIKIPAKRVVKFRLAKAFKEAVLSRSWDAAPDRLRHALRQRVHRVPEFLDVKIFEGKMELHP